MISRQFAPTRKFAGAILAAAFGSLVFPLFGATEPTPVPPAVAPAKPHRKVPPRRVESPEVAPSPVRSSTPEGFADALPTGIPAPPDLHLRPEGERIAGALVAFGDALLAEDSADTEKSLAGYRRVLELDPGYVELAVRVAYELAKRNDVSGGIQILKDAAKAAPKEPAPLVHLSGLYTKIKKPDLALKYAEQAVAVAPDDFSGYLALFDLHVAGSEPKKAEAVIEKAAKTNGGDAKFWAQLGDLYMRFYLKEDGSCQQEELLKMNAVFRKTAVLAGDDATILSRIADYFVLSRQVKEAIPLYLKVVAAPQTDAMPPLNNTRHKLAQAFIVTEQRDEAIGVLEQMAKDNPLRSDTFELLGELYQQNGDFDKALHNFEHSLIVDASQPQNYIRLNFLLLDTKHTDKAVEVMQKARARFPDVPQVAVYLAVAFSRNKQHTEALDTFAKAMTEAENNHEELLNSAFYFQYGAAAEQAGQLDKAVDLLRQCIDLDPGSRTAAQACNYLGYMWADRGERLDEAGDLIKKALELDPDEGSYLDSLGWLYFKKGEHEKALKELLHAADIIKPEDAVVFDHIADTYQAMGKGAEAMKYWQKAFALSSDDKKQADKIAEKIEAAKQKVTSGAKPKPEPAPQN